MSRRQTSNDSRRGGALADYERDMFDRATRAYTRACVREGLTAAQPSLAASIITARSVTLRNVRGTLARYVLKGSRLVRKDG